MKRVRVHNRTADRELGSHIILADSSWSRLRGMIGRPEPGPGEGMLLVPSQGVHMWWMKYPLDVALLDRERRVVATYPGLEPGKRTRIHPAARYALELPTGTLAASRTDVGHLLEWSGNGAEARRDREGRE